MPRIRPSELRRALDAAGGDALSLHFQQQVHLTSARLAGVEGFVRWPHPSSGMVGPAEIADLVEEGGLHVELDQAVLRGACRQMARWRREHVAVPLVAVSIWPQTLRRADVAEIVRDALEQGAMEAFMLEVKTARGAVADPTFAVPVRTLRALGVRIAAPYDGAATAVRVDTLKIPPSVVRDLATGSPAEATVREAVALARDTEARLVAEGVETLAQQDLLISLGCEIAQGYLYGPELAADEVGALVLKPKL